MPVLAGFLLAVSSTSTVSAAASAVVTSGGPADAMAPAGSVDSSPHFTIERYDVRGNTLLPVASVNSAVAPFLGSNRDFADVMGAVEALEQAYHALGFQLVRVDLPEQELEQGIVVLEVVQPRIGLVNVIGNQYVDVANVRRALPALREAQVPDMKAISTSLKLVNENPAKKTVMTMQTAAEGDDVDATLAVADESPWSTSLNMDNTGTGQTGRTHAGVVLQNANLFGLDHVLSLQYTTTVEHPSSVKVYSAGYHIPLYALGDSLDFFGSYSNVDAGTVTAGIFDIAVSGKGSVYGARYNQNLPQAGDFESKLVYGVDYKAYKSSLQLQGQELGNDVMVHPLSIGYQGNWTRANTALGFAATLLHNIAGGSKGGQQDFDTARVGASASYSMLRLSANLTQALPAEWQARAIFNGQYTRDALISGEQFGAGGAASVRGFEEREVSNDSGLVGNLEVYTPPLCTNTNWQCRILAFYDRARATRNNALPGEFRSISISSAGVGVSVQFQKNIDLQVDYGHVLHAEATATQTGDNRVHVRLGLTF